MFSIGYMFGPLSRSSSSPKSAYFAFQSEARDSDDFHMCPRGLCGLPMVVGPVCELVSWVSAVPCCPENVVFPAECVNRFALVIRGFMVGKQAPIIAQQDSTVPHILMPKLSQVRSIFDQSVVTIERMRMIEVTQTLH